jgi:hypothetical protein
MDIHISGNIIHPIPNLSIFLSTSSIKSSFIEQEPTIFYILFVILSKFLLELHYFISNLLYFMDYW